MVIDFTQERNVGGGKRVAELAEEVQECCPVALMFGKIDGIGEGIVWTEVTSIPYFAPEPRALYCFARCNTYYPTPSYILTCPGEETRLAAGSSESLEAS